jgi:hypothetical protein
MTFPTTSYDPTTESGNALESRMDFASASESQTESTPEPFRRRAFNDYGAGSANDSYEMSPLGSSTVVGSQAETTHGSR